MTIAGASLNLDCDHDCLRLDTESLQLIGESSACQVSDSDSQ